MQMMELVELTPLRNLLVGSPDDTGLSVEQRKRLSIAVELAANPAIVLMDEPTSGESNCSEHLPLCNRYTSVSQTARMAAGTPAIGWVCH